MAQKKPLDFGDYPDTSDVKGLLVSVRIWIWIWIIIMLNSNGYRGNGVDVSYGCTVIGLGLG